MFLSTGLILTICLIFSVTFVMILVYTIVPNLFPTQIYYAFFYLLIKHFYYTYFDIIWMLNVFQQPSHYPNFQYHIKCFAHVLCLKCSKNTLIQWLRHRRSVCRKKWLPVLDYYLDDACLGMQNCVFLHCSIEAMLLLWIFFIYGKQYFYKRSKTLFKTFFSYLDLTIW